MTYKDKGSYESSPPCICISLDFDLLYSYIHVYVWIFFFYDIHRFTLKKDIRKDHILYVLCMNIYIHIHSGGNQGEYMYIYIHMYIKKYI